MRSVKRIPSPYESFLDAIYDVFTPRAKEFIGYSLLIINCGVVLSLVSWSAQDPSLNHATSGSVHNFLGWIGAVISDLLMQFWGIGTIAIILPPFWWAWRLICKSRMEKAVGRILLWLAGIGAGSLLASCLPLTANWPLPTGLGGICGDGLLSFVKNLFGFTNETSLMLLGIGSAFAAILTITASCSLGNQKDEDFEENEYIDEPYANPPPKSSQTPSWEEEQAPSTEDEPGFAIISLGAMIHAFMSLRGRFRRWRQHRKQERHNSRENEALFETSLPGQNTANRHHEPSLYSVPLQAQVPMQDTLSQQQQQTAAPQSRVRVHISSPSVQPPQFQSIPYQEEYRESAFIPHIQPPHTYNGPSETEKVPFGGILERSPENRSTTHGYEERPARRTDIVWNEKRNAWTPASYHAHEEKDLYDELDDNYEDEIEGSPEPVSPLVQALESASQALNNEKIEDEIPWEEPLKEYTRAGRSQTVTPVINEEAKNPAQQISRTIPLHQVSRPVYDETPSPSIAMQESTGAVQNVNGKRVFREAAPQFTKNSPYELPSPFLLVEPKTSGTSSVSADALEQNAALLESTLGDFGIRGEITNVRPGPVVTLYELEPAPGTKSSRVIGLADDIARSMSAISARVAVVQGRNVIGIELPNDKRDTVYLRELLAAQDFGGGKHKLALCLGKSIGGEPVIVDLAKMPHLLIAGTTGSGKSVAINTMILSLLYRLTPEQCRLIMVDPKMLELSVYDGIPHLLTPVVTDPMKAVVALKWAVREMDDRYRNMSKLGVRNIIGFNERVSEAKKNRETITRTVQTGFDKETGEILFEEEEMDLEPLPYIVVIVDEMADLMLVAGKEIEVLIQRLAQKARAAGIHVILATQRPSVDVITGTIKANFPTRVSFQVSSKIDSRTILGEMGAEQLLGQGDMLYMAGGGRITRVHGPFCSDEEVEKVVNHLKTQAPPNYLDSVTIEEEESEEKDGAVFDQGSFGSPGADLYDQAVAIVLNDRKASTSYIQRRLQIGYNRAATLIERMENEGVISPANHAGKREVLMEKRESYDDGFD